MMKPTLESDYNLYLKHKEQGDNVVMYYEHIGYALCPAIRSDFTVLHISLNELEVYQYHVKSDGTFNIEVPQKYEHGLSKVLTAKRMSDTKTQAWWNAVFFSQADNNVHYDSYYDNLPISNHESLTCGELVSQLEQALSSCDIPNQTVFLDGEWAECKALHYIISQKNDSTRVEHIASLNNILPNTSLVINPLITKKTILPFTITGNKDFTYTLYDLYQHPIHLYVPIEKNVPKDKDVLKHILINSTTWYDILPDNDLDYYIDQNGNIGIKMVTLSASYDAFGNIFLVSTATNGKKVVHI